MEFTEFTPPTEEAAAPAGPTQKDLIMQIEADYHSEQQGQNREEELAKLDERWNAVKKAKNDQAARDAYFGHLVEATA